MGKLFYPGSIWKCGILAIDKCSNVTSANIVESVKHIIHKNYGSPLWLKIGHGGTLDESATGVLVVATGFGCKLLKYFLHGSKEYLVTGQFGIETDTYNSCGKVTGEMPFHHIKVEHIDSKICDFTGAIRQVPPIYSALKIGGKRSSDLARSGVAFELAPRTVECHKIVLKNFNPPFFDLHVTCGGGFYIRSLIHDLAKSLGSCAHVTHLRRIRHGFLKESDALLIHHADYTSLLKNAQHIAETSEYRSLVRRNKLSFKTRKFQELWIDPT